MATTVKEANVPESQKCEHKNAKHHSRGKCLKCYHTFRKSQWQRKTKLSKNWAKNPYAAILALFVICFGTIAHAEVEPYRVKADQLGESLSAWQANNKSDHCSKPGQSGWGNLLAGEDVCVWVFTGKKADRDMTYATATIFRRNAYFYEGKLYRISMEFNRSNGATVLARLTDNFANPTSADVSTYQNRLGLTFDRSVVSWTNGVSTIVFNEFDYSLSTSVVSFVLDSMQKQVSEQKQVEQK